MWFKLENPERKSKSILKKAFKVNFIAEICVFLAFIFILYLLIGDDLSDLDSEELFWNVLLFLFLCLMYCLLACLLGTFIFLFNPVNLQYQYLQVLGSCEFSDHILTWIIFNIPIYIASILNFIGIIFLVVVIVEYIKEESPEFKEMFNVHRKEGKK
jgi:hypothetical protein